MQASTLIHLVNQTGIEALLGGTPTQLPNLTDPEKHAVSQAVAVVRTEKVGLETAHAQSWAFFQDEGITMIRAGSISSEAGKATMLPDTATLAAEIEQLLPVGCMPKEAFARAELTLGDAEEVYDEIPGSSSYTASIFLVSDGLTQEDAEVAFDAMRDAAIAARISFMAVRGNELELTYGMWIGQDGEDVWMAKVTPPKSSNFTLRTVQEGTFHRSLEEGFSSLRLG